MPTSMAAPHGFAALSLNAGVAERRPPTCPALAKPQGEWQNRPPANPGWVLHAGRYAAPGILARYPFVAEAEPVPRCGPANAARRLPNRLQRTDAGPAFVHGIQSLFGRQEVPITVEILSPKRADRLAAFVLLLIAVTMIGAMAGRLFPFFFPTINEVVVSYQVKTLAGVLALATAAVQVGSAIWLYVQAARHNRPRWVWSILGLAGGVLGLLLWYLIELIRQVETLNRNERERSADQAFGSDPETPSPPSIPPSHAE